MNKEINNEMDLLLRRLGRRDEPAVSNDGNHLDADELNAYAENALPAAARTRYTEHLAECSTCRKLVAQLSSAAGVASVAESAVIPELSPLRKFLASLLSPMVLRYAAPALGLIVVAVIGFVILRRDGADQHVSQVREVQQLPAAAAPAPSTAAHLDNFNEQQQKTTPTQQARVSESDKNKDTTAAPPPNNAPAVSVQVEVPKDASAANAQPQAAAAPATAQPTATPVAPKGTTDEVARNEPQPKKPETEQATVTVMSGEKSKANFRVAEERKAEESRGIRAPVAKRAAERGGTAAKLGSVDTVRDDSAETRSVAGRRFRKRDGVWIDTAYESSRETMTLTRGSERYRALVADEPAIKTIADELDGEIIVVWKGQAYRIR